MIVRVLAKVEGELDFRRFLHYMARLCYRSPSRLHFLPTAATNWRS
jgi:hypothetical protein